MEEIYEIAFGLILHAGNSRSLSINAVKDAENGNFKVAKEKLKEADHELQLAHTVQTTMLQAEADGAENEINLLMIHAQDHLSMALSQKEVSRQILRVYERLEEMK